MYHLCYLNDELIRLILTFKHQVRNFFKNLFQNDNYVTIQKNMTT